MPSKQGNMTSKDKARLKVLAERDRVLSAYALEQLRIAQKAVESGVMWAPPSHYISALDQLIFHTRAEAESIRNTQ